ncbi:MAG TPA: hypothetical protein VFW07_14760 [Parafilimonas sp.]|nr:hypothetical protein [Parafilimonas sp.]
MKKHPVFARSIKILFLFILIQAFYAFNYKGYVREAGHTSNRIFFKNPGITESNEKIYCGFSHTLAIESNKTLWAWGNNNMGQLGDGSTVQKIIPIQVSSLSGIKDAAGGYEHSLALKSNGTVWSWGRNVEGQLGDGTTTQRKAPVKVSGLSNIIKVAAGYYHSLAIKADGSVWTWGKNNLGQLGNGTTANSSLPAKLNAITGVTDVTAGVEFSMALKSDGTVLSWGSNNWGQLGNGTTTTRSIPAPVTNGTNVIAIAAGRYHALALKADGTVWAWGHNVYGELGIGTTVYKTTPVQVLNLNNVIAIAAGEYHSLALKSDGTFWAWGRNEQGQLGDLTFTLSRNLPVEVQQLRGVSFFSAGTQTLSIMPATSTHLYWAFGNNNNGQLGDSTKINKNFRVLVHFPLDENGNGSPEWQDYQYLNTPYSDNDRDGLLDWKEIMVYGTDAGSVDTNGDGLFDGTNVLVGLGPLIKDTDGDGLTNAKEAKNGTSPILTDTDGDGVSDKEDAFPLDRFKTKKPPPNSSDHTPPVITLQEPI